MKKLIIGVVGMVFGSCVFCQSIVQQKYHFPSVAEAQKVFAQGSKLLFGKQSKEVSLEDLSYQNIYSKKQEPQSPSLLFELSQIRKGNRHDVLKYYGGIIRSSVEKNQYNQDLKHYQDFYNQIVWKKDGSPDLTKAATMKAYLAFYNLILNNKPSRPEIGRIDEHFPLLGEHSEAFAKLQERFGNNDAYLSFTLSISMVRGVTTMIPRADSKKAEKIAKQILYNDLQKYDMTTEQIDKWLEVATSENGKAILDESESNGIMGQVSSGSEWYCLIFLRPQNKLLVVDKFEYVPFGLIALHEFEHAKDLFPGRERDLEDSLSELPTYVMEIVMLDNIYRQIHNIPDTQLVSYKHGDESINLGEIADLFRKLSKKYHTDNWPELLLTPEATTYINNVYKKQTEIAGRLVLQRQYGVNVDLISEDKIQEVGRQVIHEMYLEEMFRNTNRTGKVIPQ